MEADMGKPRSFCILAATTLVAGCSGGGGGGFLEFLGFSQLAASESYKMAGQAVVADFQVDQATGAVSVDPSEQEGVNVNFDLDAGGVVTRAAIERVPPPGSRKPDPVEFDTNKGDTIADGATVDPALADFAFAETASGDEIALVGDPVAKGFEYQTFGIWATGLNAGMGVFGAASVGAPTVSDRNSLPAMGIASYDGMSSGVYVDPTGEAFLAVADFDATVDFSTLMMSVDTLGTTVIPLDGGISAPMASLDFSGNGMAAADGSFSTAINATDLAGSLNGQFYGPNAEEVGGAFDMTGAAGRYVGAVGAAQ